MCSPFIKEEPSTAYRYNQLQDAPKEATNPPPDDDYDTPTPTYLVVQQQVNHDSHIEKEKENFYGEENGYNDDDHDNDYYEIPGLTPLEKSEHASSDDSSSDRRSVKFATTPIRVYATYSASCYDRRNDDIDPISASAEYELEKRIDKMDVFEAELERGADGLGLSIIGMGVGAEHGLQKLGIFVKTITAGGSASRDGRLRVGDQIIEVDGVSLVGVTQTLAAAVLRATQGRVNFRIGREKVSFFISN